MAVYCNIMKHVRYFCVVRFLHVDDNKEDPDKMADNYDWLTGKWELYWNSSVIHMLNITAQLYI
jgi:hypothetical protein